MMCAMTRYLIPLIGMLIALGQPFSAAEAANCANTSVSLVPLTDLGSGLYQGNAGGLYENGSNARPAAHNAAGLAIANSIVPLDTLGNPDPDHGRIVLISIGMSNATQEFSAFVPKAMSDPARHPRLLVIDCAQGGQSADRINVPDAAYWDAVSARLRAAGSAPRQAQVAWIKEANAGPTGGFLTSAEALQRNLAAVVRIIKQKLPNVRLAYLTSRIYAGYANTSLNPEPYAYESGFAVKWLIEEQISGEDSLNFDPGAGAAEAPWLSWGPYLWADGLSPRSDGLIWKCEDFAADGTHPSTSGRNLVADSLLAFFKRDETTVPWFVNPGTTAVPTRLLGDLRIVLAPNPGRGAVGITYGTHEGAPWKLDILDLSGRRIRDLDRGLGNGGVLIRWWDGRDNTGARARAGIYWVRLTSGSQQIARRLALLESF